jgi:hypothetical protein
MTAAKISNYDPLHQAKYEREYETAIELWRRAIQEKQEFGSIRAETRSAWIETIKNRRNIRRHAYATTSDVARKMFNILAARAAMAGHKMPEMPNPDDFSSLREIREFFTDQMEGIKAARETRKRPVVNPMPVLPRGEGRIFNGVAAPEDELVTQAFYIPDLDNGFAVIVMSQRVGDDIYICLSGKSDPNRFRTLMPQLATLIHQRLFGESDPNNMHFFVHHPQGHGYRYQEQFWKYDVRPDARGAFRMAAREQVQMLPYGVAHKVFMDGLPERETRMIDLDKYWPYRAGVEMVVAKQEKISARLKAADELKAAVRAEMRGPVLH